MSGSVFWQVLFSSPARRKERRGEGRAGVRLVLAAAACGLAGLAAQAGADPPQVRVTADADLRFGTILAFGGGARTVTAGGSVIDQGLFAIDAGDTGPASFTISYDRGNESRRPLDIEIELVISQPSQLQLGGVTGRLSAFQSDWPGAISFQPGQALRISMPGCTERVCARSLRVGARLDVTRSHGGASLVFPLPVLASVIAAR